MAKDTCTCTFVSEIVKVREAALQTITGSVSGGELQTLIAVTLPLPGTQPQLSI